MNMLKDMHIAARLGLIGLGIVIYAAPAFTQSKADTPPVLGSPKDNRLVIGYKQWTKVNPRPVYMQPAAAAACASAQPTQLASPHLQKYVTVYVNAPGKEAMTRCKSPHFPVGTVIVKEKLSTPGSRAPELLTVMVRREKGFSEENGDWEYLVFNGAGTQITAQGKMEKCQSCHLQATSTDFVFRDHYLSEKLRTALK